MIQTTQFSDGIIDHQMWSTVVLGNGPTVLEDNSQLEISLSGNSVGIEESAGPYLDAGLFLGGIQTNFKLVGDFDIRVHYELLDWPAGNGARSGIRVPWGMERMSFILDGDYYLTHFYDGLNSIPTTDQNGAIRIIRNGSNLSGYYQDSDKNWILIHSGPGPSDPTPIALSLWGHDGQFLGQDVKISVLSMDRDDFQGRAYRKSQLGPTPETVLGKSFPVYRVPVAAAFQALRLDTKL